MKMRISNNGKLPRFMVVCAARLPSAELGAMIPLSVLQRRGLLELQYRNESELTLNDILWTDVLYLIRGTSPTSLRLASWAKHFERKVLGLWDDDLTSVPNHCQSYKFYAQPSVKKSITSLFHLTDTLISPCPHLANKLTKIYGHPVVILPGPSETETPNIRISLGQNIPTIGYSGSTDALPMLETLIGPVLENLANKGFNLEYT